MGIAFFLSGLSILTFVAGVFMATASNPRARLAFYF
jgi:hypothetical protein